MAGVIRSGAPETTIVQETTVVTAPNLVIKTTSIHAVVVHTDAKIRYPFDMLKSMCIQKPNHHSNNNRQRRRSTKLPRKSEWLTRQHRRCL